MQTIAQQLNIKTFPFRIEVDGHCVYSEYSHGDWHKNEYQDGECVYYENSNGFWARYEWQDGKCVYYEDSDGYWCKRGYQDGKEVYYENSNGHIEDDRPKSKAQAKVEKARKLLEEAEKELNDL